MFRTQKINYFFTAVLYIWGFLKWRNYQEENERETQREWERKAENRKKADIEINF